MKHSSIFLFLLFLLFLYSCSEDKLEIKTDSLSIGLSNQGKVESISSGDTEYLFSDSTSYLISVQSNDQVHNPSSIVLEGSKMKVSFESLDLNIGLSVDQGQDYLRLEVVEVSDASKIDVLLWGPYLTTISSTIGETVGVVRDGNYAIGIQSLNPKTLGGYPWNGNDAMPQIDIFESGDFSDLSEEGKRHVLYRVEAAKPIEGGSSLQAYVRNRKDVREVENLNHDHYLVQPYEDGGVVGSAIAIFGCAEDEILDKIESIELAEGLPHPMIDGVWGKRTPSAAAAYMILGFGENDIQKAIDYTKQAGLRYLYHPGPFETWGKFLWNESAFPDGTQSMKRCVEIAEGQGVMLGLHTLSNFITTNDPYVTPVPDPRLGKVGHSILVSGIDETATEIEVKDPKFFDQFRNNHLRSVQIGDELIQYGGVSKESPYKLLDCQRGAFGTEAATHESGGTVYKLVDHGYKVFLSEPSLSIEMAKNIADIYNEAGLRQISFDGLEGNRSTGMGNYGEILFTDTWYNSLSDEIKGHYIADASRTTHYFWHMYTRMNWGEPWYAGFRESQQEYRLKNQAYFKRNLMPAMLGWFLYRETTSVEDIEWLLARSAAFDAGYSFVASYEAFEENGNTDKVLDLVGTWEKLRIGQKFSDEQKEKMKDVNREFTLSGSEEDGYALQEFYIAKNKHIAREKQPGEPTHVITQLDNKGPEQHLRFVITAPAERAIDNVWLEIDNYKRVEIPGQIPPGSFLKYEGGESIHVLDSKWNLVREISVDRSKMTISEGQHTILFDCQFQKEGDEVKLEFKSLSTPERVG